MTARIIQILTAAGKPQRVTSSEENMQFLSVLIGPSALEIKETSSHFDFSAKRLTNVATPTAASDVATKGYADSIAAGFDPKESVHAATAAALPAVTAAGSGVGKTLTANANGALTVDGHAMNAGERVLVKNQVTGANNGIYDVTDAGSAGTPFILTRSTDFDGTPSGEVSNGAYMLVSQGSTNAGTNWFLATTGSITVDTTSLTFSQASSPGAVTSVNTQTGAVVLDTDAISEGATNLYYTNGRFDTQFGTKDTDDLGEGATNLYYTAGRFNTAFGAKTTDDLGEGATNLYFTNARAKSAAVENAINSGTTDIAPSEDAVFAALSNKATAYATKTNDFASAITQGQIVYLKSNGNVDRARANAAGTADAILYAVQAASIASASNGYLHNLRGDVVTVPGSSFTIGGAIYLSAATAALVTQTAPTTVNQFIVPLGKALSATTFEWDPQDAIEIVS